MKRILAAAITLSVLAVQPVQAGFEKKKTEAETAVTAATTAAAAVPAAAPAPAVPAAAHAPAAPAAAAPAPTKDDLAQRSQKGVDNQKAWVATLEKQLEGEKAKLAAMEAEHSKAFGSSSKKG